MTVDSVTTIPIPEEYRKKTTLASNLYYDLIEIYENRVIGYLNGTQMMTWYFKDYSGVDMVNANMNSQFAQVVFLTGINSRNRFVGVDFGSAQNRNAMNDTNKLLLCSGMFSFKKTNEFAESVSSKIKTAFNDFKNNETLDEKVQSLSAADEIKKFKDLLDNGVITQEEFDTKKKQLLSL